MRPFCSTESLCCTPEANTLYVNYIAIKKKKRLASELNEMLTLKETMSLITEMCSGVEAGKINTSKQCIKWPNPKKLVKREIWQCSNGQWEKDTGTGRYKASYHILPE